MEFNTIAISDGTTMGTEGMKASLVSRELIADSIELVGRGLMFDAVIALVACNKTIPGGAMGLIRLDVPSLALYGGSIMVGRFKGRDVTVQDVFEAVGAHAAGRMLDEDLKELENVACRGVGGGPVRTPIKWQEPAPRYASGVFAKYAALVSSASEGAITPPRLLRGFGTR
jgi:dihydroxy-acid dehydratase